MRILIVTAVDAEARAIGRIDAVEVVAGGLGRTNAAATTTETVLKRGPFDAVISAGVAGALPSDRENPSSSLTIGDVIVASACIYAEEGLISSTGFAGIAAMGFSLGDFEGNSVPVDERLLELLGERFRVGPIATVATCSGTDTAAAEVVRRTGAIAEAMEGAAVVHAARRLRVPAIEIRSISNATGERSRQLWDLPRALESLGEAVRTAAQLLHEP